MGDLKIILLEYSNITKKFDNLIESFNLQQVVLNAIRYSLAKSSLLDVIMISNTNLLCGEIEHIDMHEHSDHHQLIYGTYS